MAGSRFECWSLEVLEHCGARGTPPRLCSLSPGLDEVLTSGGRHRSTLVAAFGEIPYHKAGGWRFLYLRLPRAVAAVLGAFERTT
jgi:hypothetical protein